VDRPELEAHKAERETISLRANGALLTITFPSTATVSSEQSTGPNKHTQKVALVMNSLLKKKLKQTPWSESASELYRPSDRRLSAK
jgi:hypothetical protein